MKDLVVYKFEPHFWLIAALNFSAGYYSAPIFLQFKEFELYWCAVFLRCVHTFFNDFDLPKRDKQVKPSGH